LAERDVIQFSLTAEKVCALA